MLLLWPSCHEIRAMRPYLSQSPPVFISYLSQLELPTLFLDALDHQACNFWVKNKKCLIPHGTYLCGGTSCSQNLNPVFLWMSTPLLFKLSTQTLATSPNRYAAGISGSAASSSYLVKGIRAALSFSQECGMAELLTKSDRLDIQSLCSRVMLPIFVALSISNPIATITFQGHLRNC